MDKKRCIWSGRRESGLKEITVESTDRFGGVVEKTFHVLPEHEEEFIDFNRYLVRYVRPFLWSVVNLTVAIVVLPLAAHLMGFVTMGLGAAIRFLI